MANYISSTANRFYVATEAAYGQAAPVSLVNRFPAVRFLAHQVVEGTKRHDKTGTRTFLGAPRTGRRVTAFEIRSYLTSWSGSGEPGYGPFFRAAMGTAPQFSGTLSITAVQGGTQIQTTVPHGLTVGSAVSFGNEIRFVASVIDAASIIINAGFSTAPIPGQALGPAVTYRLASALPSLLYLKLLYICGPFE
jgi:hypothetical protein